MRVYIGPYITYIGPYSLADKLFWFLNEERRDAIGVWMADGFIGNFLEWLYKKRKRNIKIHIDNYDTWNADQTLAIVILAVLKNIRKNLCSTSGFPLINDEDVPENLKVPEGLTPFEVDEELLVSRYAYVLDRMIEGFELNADTEEFWKGEPKDGDGEYAIDKFIEEQERKQEEAMRLFTKYFHKLWN